MVILPKGTRTPEGKKAALNWLLDLQFEENGETASLMKFIKGDPAKKLLISINSLADYLQSYHAAMTPA
jgi:hypothetical protein